MEAEMGEGESTAPQVLPRCAHGGVQEAQECPAQGQSMGSAWAPCPALSPLRAPGGQNSITKHESDVLRPEPRLQGE